MCKGCALGKYAKVSFPSSDNRSKGILDMIHSDVGGTMSTVSLSGYYYYVIFIDYFNRGMLTGVKIPRNKGGSLPVLQVPIRLMNVWYGKPNGIMDPLPSRG